MKIATGILMAPMQIRNALAIKAPTSINACKKPRRSKGGHLVMDPLGSGGMEFELQCVFAA
jgi:hypothetical protein